MAVMGGQNLLRNPGFEERDGDDPRFPAGWTEQRAGAAPLAFTSQHYEGAAAGMMIGDGKERLWRQNIVGPKARIFTLSAFVKAENVVIGRGDSAYLYVHIIYKDRPYSKTTHLSVKILPGTYDWKRLSIHGMANSGDEIRLLHISVGGKFSAGRIFVDQVEIKEDELRTPKFFLKTKVEDLLTQLDRVGELDETVQSARTHLVAARQLLTQSSPDLDLANRHWVQAAETVSHAVWARIFPEAMSRKTVEARMLYHGISRTKEECYKNLDTIQKAGCNACYLSLGSWISVVYPSAVIPTDPDWRAFNALEYFIAEAHRRNIKVFGYLATFYGTHDVKAFPGGMVVEHPEWLARAPDSNMPRFPDPANPDVVDFVVRAYTELATRYDMDGIGLDYIRYPTASSLNYDERNRDAILKRYGFDISKTNELFKDEKKWADIIEYRARNIGQVVKRVSDAVRAARKDITIMACLASNPDYARDSYGQDWENSSKWIDYATPMNYDDTSENIELIQRQRDIFRKHQAVFIPAIGGMPHIQESWTISQWAKRVAIQREVGCDGIIIYRIAEFDPAVVAFFGKGPFYGNASFPVSTKSWESKSE